MDSRKEATAADAVRVNEEQLVLLRDSNNLLRTEVEQFKVNLNATHDELESMKKATQPIETIQREMDMKVLSLKAEKESLERELESWKRRMTSLVSNFNQIDPEEHRLLQKKLEEMKQESESHNAWKKTIEEENTRIRSIAQNLNKQRKELQQKVEAQKTDLEQLLKEKTALSAASGAGSQTQKELDEMKQRVGKMENDAKSAKTELDGANSRNDRLRDKLREFQNLIRDLRSKEKSLTEQLKEMQDFAAANASTAVTNVVVDTTKPVDSIPPEPIEKIEKAPVTEAAAAQENADANQEATITIPTPPSFNFGPSKGTTVSLRPSAVPFEPPTATAVSISKPSANVPDEKEASTKRSIDSISKIQTDAEKTQEATKEVKEDAISSESKELAFKEKLLERKRQLAEALKEKALRRKQKEAEQDQTKADTEESQHVPKKLKTENKPPPMLDSVNATETESAAQVERNDTIDTAAADSEANPSVGTTEVADAIVANEEDATQESAPAEAIVIDDEKNTDGQPDMEAEAVVVDVENTDGVGAMEDDNVIEDDDNIEAEIETDDVAESMDESAITKTTLPFVSPFGPTASNTFGGSPGPIFGQSSSIMPTPFGSNPMDSATTTSAGSAPLFGTFGSGAASFGNANANVTVLSSSTSVPFGSAAFLDIKPPSSHLTPGTIPKFTFGNSGSNITLPTPTIPTNPSGGSSTSMMSPQPFGMFPSAPFGGGGGTTAPSTFGSLSSTASASTGGFGSAMPLFGTSSSIAMAPQPISTTNMINLTDAEVEMDENIDNGEGAMDAQEEE